MLLLLLHWLWGHLGRNVWSLIGAIGSELGNTAASADLASWGLVKLAYVEEGMVDGLHSHFLVKQMSDPLAL